MLTREEPTAHHDSFLSYSQHDHATAALPEMLGDHGYLRARPNSMGSGVLREAIAAALK